jgi:hypothetical protein
MPALLATVRTPRADRYLGQLSSHLGHGPGGLQVLSSSDDSLLVDLGVASWSIRATPTDLVLRLDCDDTDVLAQQAERVGRRIESLGRRDGLQVNWEPTTD